MAYEKEYDAVVNREGDIEEVILREVGGGHSVVFRPEKSEQGKFIRDRRYKLTFTEIGTTSEIEAKAATRANTGVAANAGVGTNAGTSSTKQDQT